MVILTSFCLKEMKQVDVIPACAEITSLLHSIFLDTYRML